MKFIKQFSIILSISFLGECLSYFLPLPVPGSIYGLVLLFLCLWGNWIPLEAVRDTGMFLIELLPLLFIPSAAGLLDTWGILRPVWLPYAAIIAVSSLAVMGVSGRITQAVLRHRKGDNT